MNKLKTRKMFNNSSTIHRDIDTIFYLIMFQNIKRLYG